MNFLCRLLCYVCHLLVVNQLGQIVYGLIKYVD